MAGARGYKVGQEAKEGCGLPDPPSSACLPHTWGKLGRDFSGPAEGRQGHLGSRSGDSGLGRAVLDAPFRSCLCRPGRMAVLMNRPQFLTPLSL